ncbi:MAG TPA: SCO family protein [Rhizomicrobium sp.]
MLGIKWFGVLALALTIAACSPAGSGNETDISGVMPRLEFSLVRANDGRPVDAENYRGKAVLLYFGYTHCPDQCPTTLTDLSDMLRRMGPRAKDTRVLFVTVDPARDTIPVMRRYVGAFGPEIDGLRGNPNAVAALARRYRVLYETTPGKPGQPYDVMHSGSVFVFDRDGRARIVLTSTKDIARLASEMEEMTS